MARHFESDTTIPASGTIAVQGGRFEVVGGNSTSSLVVGAERQLIGRAPQCALVIEDGLVSAIHLEVQATTRGVRILDLGSRNGTFIGDIRVIEVYVNGPCELRCGQTRLRFVPTEPEEVVLSAETRFGALVGASAPMRALFATLRQFAGSDLSLLITGETGTGKEVVAHAVHDASPRRGKSFLAINCAAMTEGLLEDELFGHVRGAFTSADKERAGLFVEADGGTLFFDEVAEMSSAMQAKLLRVLENREVRAVGSDRSRKVNVRTIFATHESLEEAVNRGKFRSDLFFRISQVNIEIPPLRARLDDLPLLVRDILERVGRPEATVDAASLKLLRNRSWPGNVRELRNVIEVALVASPGNVMSFHGSLPAARMEHRAPLETMTFDDARREFKYRYYMNLYSMCRGNITQIAIRAGKTRPTVKAALVECGIETRDDDSDDGDGGSAHG